MRMRLQRYGPRTIVVVGHSRTGRASGPKRATGRDEIANRSHTAVPRRIRIQARFPNRPYKVASTRPRTGRNMSSSEAGTIEFADVAPASSATVVALSPCHAVPRKRRYDRNPSHS